MFYTKSRLSGGDFKEQNRGSILSVQLNTKLPYILII